MHDKTDGLMFEWWNPMSGCTRCGPGCVNCYAMKELEAGTAATSHVRKAGTTPQLHPEELTTPYTWADDARFVFVCDEGDLFHDDVPDSYIRDVFDVINRTPHTYEIVTKHVERMVDFAAAIRWPCNAWAGVSIENNDFAWRSTVLGKMRAPQKFVLAAPLLGALPDLRLDGIDFVSVAGERGVGFRAMDTDWARQLRDRCTSEGVDFIFLHHAAAEPKARDRELDGVVWNREIYPREWAKEFYWETEMLDFE